MLKKTLLLLITLLLIANQSYADVGDEFADEVNSVLSKKAEELNLSTAILSLAKIASQDLLGENVQTQKYSHYFEEAASDIGASIGNAANAKIVATIISNYFFNTESYKPASALIDGIAERTLINKVIDTHEGNCLSLSLMYLIIAEKINLPLFGIIGPDHVFLVLDNGINHIYIETTQSGGIYSDLKLHPNYSQDVHSTLYFRPLTNKEVLAIYINNLAIAYKKKDYLSVAERVFRRVLKEVPEFVSALNNLGNVLSKSGQEEEANQLYQKALLIDPKNANTLYNIGNGYAESNNWQQAIVMYKQALELDTDLSDAQYNLGRAYGELGQYSKEIDMYNALLLRNPNYYKAQSDLGKAYVQIKNYEHALASFEKAIQLNPEKAGGDYFNAAMIYASRQKLKIARDYLEKAEKAGYPVPRGLFEKLNQQSRQDKY